MTGTEPGSPAGEVLRRYWQPAALTEELDEKRPVIPVSLCGERLALFRDDRGRYGLIERQCPHRGVDLCFGRLEDGGLRCLFHGWLFDVQGNCLEQPAEPAGSRSHEHVKHRAYPCIERNGIVFAWLGEGVPPPLPALECFEAPATCTFAFKGLIESNWLQVVEVGIDPAHASFLHRFLEDENPADAYGKQFRAAAAESMPLTRILREHPRPAISVEETSYGLRLIATRDISSTQRHFRVTNLVFPNAIVIPMSAEMTITQWHVPIDNRSCYWYALFTSFGGPVDREAMRRQRLELYELPAYRPRLNRDNHWGFDPENQRIHTYTGMGPDINVHDQWAMESMGAIQDRTREHLGKSDVAIVKFRKLLKQALAHEPWSARQTDTPVAVDMIAAPEETNCWRDSAAARRQRAPWGVQEATRASGRVHFDT